MKSNHGEIAPHDGAGGADAGDGEEERGDGWGTTGTRYKVEYATEDCLDEFAAVVTIMPGAGGIVEHRIRRTG